MPGAIVRPHSSLTYSPRAGPVSARLVFQSSRWLRHQHTEDPGFLGPSIVATSPNRAVVAGWTSMLTGPGYSALVAPVLRGRQVEGGVAVEETVGPELEPDDGDRHHGPVLRADHVLVGVLPGRETLAGIVRVDPQVPGDSLSPGDPPGAWRPARRAAGRWT